MAGHYLAMRGAGDAQQVCGPQRVEDGRSERSRGTGFEPLLRRSPWPALRFHASLALAVLLRAAVRKQDLSRNKISLHISLLCVAQALVLIHELIVFHCTVPHKYRA